jgi:hypothetical protein
LAAVSQHSSRRPYKAGRWDIFLKCIVVVPQGLLGVVLQLGDWAAAQTVAGALTMQDAGHPHAASVLHSLQQLDHR